MTDDRKRQLMQESLDDQLSAEAEQELQEHLARNPEAASRYSQLQRVDMMLRTAPHERAPERLAVTIMARLAQTIQEQQRASQQPQTEISEATMQVALQLVTVATLPLLVGAGYLLLNAHSNPETLEAVLLQVAAMLTMVIETVTIMLDEAAAVFEENPEVAMAMLALIPVTLLTLVRQVLGIPDAEDETPAEPPDGDASSGPTRS
ncbi:MAG: anti-sigma factor family protein [Phototrophicaceae bacterium]